MGDTKEGRVGVHPVIAVFIPLFLGMSLVPPDGGAAVPWWLRGPSSVQPVTARVFTPSYSPSINADGRAVAFASRSDALVPGDVNGTDDVFVHRSKGITLASIATDGTQGDAASFSPSISADGRYVAFASFATNLVPGDTNMAGDVFVHDRVTGETRRLSVPAH